VVISFADIRNGIGDKDYQQPNVKKMSSKIPQATMTLKQVLCKCGFMVCQKHVRFLIYVMLQYILVVESYMQFVYITTSLCRVLTFPAEMCPTLCLDLRPLPPVYPHSVVI
jgi:hypothetical protein